MWWLHGPPSTEKSRKVPYKSMRAGRITLALQREARIDEGAANGLGVFFGYTAGAQGLVPRRLDSRLHVVDDLLRFVFTEQKACMLREYVLRIGVAAHVAAIQGEVTAFYAHG